MRGVRFYLSCLWLAFRHSFGMADLWAGIVGAAVAGILPRVWPEASAAMTDLAWQVPLGAFVSVFVVRLLLAPYWLYRESDDRRRLLEDQLNERGYLRELSQQLATYIKEGDALFAQQIKD